MFSVCILSFSFDSLYGVSPLQLNYLHEQMATFPNSKLVFNNLDKFIYIMFASCVHIRLSKLIHYTV